MCEIDTFFRGGPKGDVLCYALRNPHVIHEMDRCAALVVSLRLIRMTNLVDAAQTNLMSSTK